MPMGWMSGGTSVELRCKVLCHNLCMLIQSFYDLGIEPEFSVRGRRWAYQ
jgi:hypothetical protein